MAASGARMKGVRTAGGRGGDVGGGGDCGGGGGDGGGVAGGGGDGGGCVGIVVGGSDGGRGQRGTRGGGGGGGGGGDGGASGGGDGIRRSMITSEAARTQLPGHVVCQRVTYKLAGPSMLVDANAVGMMCEQLTSYGAGSVVASKENVPQRAAPGPNVCAPSVTPSHTSTLPSQCIAAKRSRRLYTCTAPTPSPAYGRRTESQLEPADVCCAVMHIVLRLPSTQSDAG